MEAEIDVLRALGVEFRCGVEVGKGITIAQLREEGYKGFYVAVGLQHGGALAVPGGDAENVISGIDFIRGVHLRDEKALKGRRGPHRRALRRGEREPVLPGGL